MGLAGILQSMKVRFRVYGLVQRCYTGYRGFCWACLVGKLLETFSVYEFTGAWLVVSGLRGVPRT